MVVCAHKRNVIWRSDKGNETSKRSGDCESNARFFMFGRRKGTDEHDSPYIHMERPSGWSPQAWERHSPSPTPTCCPPGTRHQIPSNSPYIYMVPTTRRAFLLPVWVHPTPFKLPCSSLIIFAFPLCKILFIVHFIYFFILRPLPPGGMIPYAIKEIRNNEKHQ